MRQIKLTAQWGGTSMWRKAGYQFDPDHKSDNRRGLIEGIDEVLLSDRAGIYEAEKAALTRMRDRLMDEAEPMPTVEEIATISKRSAVGKAVLAPGWFGIKDLAPPNS